MLHHTSVVVAPICLPFHYIYARILANIFTIIADFTNIANFTSFTSSSSFACNSCSLQSFCTHCQSLPTFLDVLVLAFAYNSFPQFTWKQKLYLWQQVIACMWSPDEQMRNKHQIPIIQSYVRKIQRFWEKMPWFWNCFEKTDVHASLISSIGCNSIMTHNLWEEQ